MKQFVVYFEIYGKKMKTVVDADNGIQAQQKVRERLNIVKVRQSQKDESDEFLDHFKNMMGFN